MVPGGNSPAVKTSARSAPTLSSDPNQVLNREQILSAVWGFDYYGDTNVVDVYIRYVRKKIEKAASNAYIHTVRGVGYMLKDAASET